MPMFKCPYCSFDAMYVDMKEERCICPVCGYVQGLKEPSSEKVALAKAILKIAPKLRRDKFPFDLDVRKPLVERPDVIFWLNKSKK